MAKKNVNHQDNGRHKLKKLALNHRGALAIVGAVLLANILYLAGMFNSNPIYQRAGILSGNKPGLVRGLDTIDPNDGYTSQALGHQAARDLRHGHMPWWNYNEQVGAPLAGEMQSAALFPFTLILGLFNGLLFFHIILEIIAGLSTYYLLRKLGCSELASLTGGILFALNGTFSWLTNAAFNPVAFLPLLLLGVEGAYRSALSNKKNGWFIIAIALALSLYAGFPETAYLDSLMAVGWVLIRSIQLRRGPWISFVVKASLGGFVGLMLSAPILLAFISYYPYANVGIHTGASGLASLNTVGIPALILPYVYGPIFAFYSFDSTASLLGWWGSVGGYITTTMLFLALFGVFSKKQRALGIFLGIGMLVVVARIYGLHIVSEALNLIPGVSSTAFYRYIFPVLELGIVILAAFGFDRFTEAAGLNKRRIIGVFSAVLALVVLAGIYASRLNISNAPHHRLWLVASIGWGLLSVCFVFFSWLLLKKYMRIMLTVVLILDALVMFVMPQLSAPRQPQLDLAPVQFLQANLGNYRFFSLGPIAPNYGSYFDIASINTNNLPISKNWSKYVTNHLYSNVDPIVFTGTNQANQKGPTPLKSFLSNIPSYEEAGVKYVITPNGLISAQEIAAKGLKEEFKDPTSEILSLPKPKPYFEISHGSCVLNVKDKNMVDTDCSTPSTLMRRELYMPGWVAKGVNDSGVQTQPRVKQSGELFQSVNLPKGHTKLVLNYSPPYLNFATTAFILGVIIPCVFYRRSLVEVIRSQKRKNGSTK